MQIRTFSAFRANAVRQATVEVRVGSKTGPLATELVDGNGNPLDNPFPLPSNGRVDFAAPDGTYWINITGPGFSVWEQAQFLDAQTVIDWQDNLDAAEQARDESEAAADRAGMEATAAIEAADRALEYPQEVAKEQIFLTGISIISNETYLLGFRDERGNMLWPSILRETGGPPDWSRDFLISIFRSLYMMPKVQQTYTGLLWAICDENRNPFWNAVGPDGGPTDWAIELLKQRLGISGGGLVRQQDKYIHMDGSVQPVLPDMTRMIGWGSSTMQGLHSYMSEVASQLGTTYTNGGKGGERSEHIFARLGSRPMLLAFSDNKLPASGGATVTSSNVTEHVNMASYTGSVRAYDDDDKEVIVFGTMSSTATTFTFTRTGSGGTYRVDPDTPFIPLLGMEFRNAAVIIGGAGKNDFSPIVPGREIQVIERTDAAFEFLAPLTKRCIIMGNFADTNTSEDSLEREQILATNAHQAARYGDLYIDIYGYLTGEQVWLDTGLTPTSDDLAAQAIGNKPPSLSSDNAHMNAAAYEAVAQFLIKPKMVELGWYAG